ncbi:MAG: type II secretion system ATPase GspE [Chrysiogenetes bacterium]|nr:type II secretion system ATPase GspE [Chrysiogenetes bacterium]
MASLAEQLTEGLARTLERPLEKVGDAISFDPDWQVDQLPESEERDRWHHVGRIRIDKKKVDEAALYKVLAELWDLPLQEDIKIEDVDLDIVRRFPINLARQYELLPMRRDNGSLRVAVAHPSLLGPLEDVQHYFGAPLEIILVPPTHVTDAINRVYDRATGTADAALDDLGQQESGPAGLDELANELNEPADLLDAGDEEAPIIRLVNTLLYQSVKERASDIHIEPYEKDVSVRYRVDGVLHEIIRAPKRFQASISSRIKVMAGLNIAEKRLPQDGRIKIKIAGRDVDIRVSTVPTTFGERIVMRLLDKSNVLMGLEQLGLNPIQQTNIEGIITKSHGIFLVTGPTGSGKSTTLYACLQRINSPDKMIITVEDPVEYQVSGVGQIQVNPKIDLTFASGLRSILRQDPDVIMIGEIRDRETAEIAIQASLTGHLVFSTLHTNDAAGAVTRLIDMGIEPFLVASSLLAVQAQRLVRVLCKNCKTPYMPSETELGELGLKPSDVTPEDTFFRATGCERCQQTGYAGRIGIYELLMVDDIIREHIMQNSDATRIKKDGVKGGMLTLRDDGVRKIRMGVTSAAEVLRITQEDIN